MTAKKPNGRRKRQRAKRVKETQRIISDRCSSSLTFGQLMTAVREKEQASLAAFAERLEISRQHLNHIERGQKRVSPERALRFAGALGHDELIFVQTALQDVVDDLDLDALVSVDDVTLRKGGGVRSRRQRPSPRQSR